MVTQSVDELIAATIPSAIRSKHALKLSQPLTESELIERLKKIAAQNQSNWRSYIGMGYYSCHTPAVIMRNVFENPGQNSVVAVKVSHVYVFCQPLTLQRQVTHQVCLI